MGGQTTRTLINDGIGRLKEAGIVNSRLEAELLLSKASGWPRPVVLIHTERPVPEEALARFHGLIARRCRREPLQQILGDTEFFGLKFLVDGDVMAPRPETEVLVEQVIKRWRPGFRAILDIGTGSGCLAVALAMNLPGCSVDAVDISEKALETANRNIELHGLAGRVAPLLGDLVPKGQKTYDVIVSNPPYIPSGEIDDLMPEVSRYEPRLALDGGGDGLEYYRKIAAAAPSRLGTPGLLALEVGEGQAAAVGAMMSEAFGRSNVSKAKDLCGADRVVMVET
jgi:release factor glutamine methyltransferase